MSMENTIRNESETTIHAPCLKRARRTGEFSNVKVRIRSEEFNLHLLPLLSECPYFRRILSSTCIPFNEPSGPIHVIDIPDFPGGQEAFSIAMDCCYGLTTPDITLVNVVKLFAAANFLEMKGLMSMTLSFVEENASTIDWIGCLRLLATVDDNELFSRCSALFEAVQTVFLKKVTIPEVDIEFHTECGSFLNVTILPSVVKLLPPSTARKILDRLARDFALVYEDHNSEGDSICLVSYLYLEDSQEYAVSRNSRKCAVCCWSAEEAVDWLLQLEFQSFEQDSLLLIYLSRLISVDYRGHDKIWKVFSGDFLCALLQAATKLHSLYDAADVGESEAVSICSSDMMGDLDKEIGAMREIVGSNLDKLTAEVLQRLDFSTFKSVIEHFWMRYDTAGSDSDLDLPRADEVTQVVYPCIVKHLQENFDNEQNVMFLFEMFIRFLITSESHENTVYNVFKHMLHCPITSHHLQELREMIDYSKLPGKVVDELLADSVLGYEPPLLKRVLDLNTENLHKLESLKKMQHSVQSTEKVVVGSLNQKLETNGESAYQEKCVELVPQVMRANNLLLKRVSALVSERRTLCENEGKPIPVFNDHLLLR